jgi:hypothetical protein
MIAKKKEEPQRIGAIVSEVLSERGYLSVCKEYGIMRKWPAIAPPVRADRRWYIVCKSRIRANASGSGLSKGKTPPAHSEGRGMPDHKGHCILLRKQSHHE